MSKIIRYSNWGYWEQLDGKTLQNGERLRVMWPDGVQEELTVIVVDHGVPIDHHGHSYTGKDVRAYAILYHHGVEIRVPLLGLEAERVTHPQPTHTAGRYGHSDTPSV